MTTKEKVYQLLIKSGSRFISGQAIASEIFVTRAAVWKAINALKKDGIQIEAVTNKGYRLTEALNIINKDIIIEEIDRDYFEYDYLKDVKIETYQKVESTNDLAREYALSLKDSEMVIIADSQTKGRGRKGRDFYSPSSTGLYMSFVLFPHTDFNKAMSYTVMAANCVCEAIKKVTGIETQIKWVNDIYYKDKKIAGILTEGISSVEDGTLQSVVIGIGINIYAPYEGFPEDIRKKAGALLEYNTDSSVRDRLAGAVIGEFYKSYKEPEKYPYLLGYKSKSMLVGKYVEIIDYGTIKHKDKFAKVIEIDDECRLVVMFDNGEKEVLSTGEVSVVKY